MRDYKLLMIIGKEFIKNENFKRFVCGTYSDDTTRSLSDAIRGEFKSPKTKAKESKKRKKKNKHAR